MMNFKCIGNIGLKLTTVLASMVVSFTGGTVICSPIYTVIRFISAFPCWGFIAHNVCGLPFPHALCGAKVMLRNVCVLTAEILSTPVAMNYLASPPEGSRRAGTRTGNSASPFPTQTICSHRESLSTYLTGQLLSGGMKFVVNLLAIVEQNQRPVVFLFIRQLDRDISLPHWLQLNIMLLLYTLLSKSQCLLHPNSVYFPPS